MATYIAVRRLLERLADEEHRRQDRHTPTNNSRTASQLPILFMLPRSFSSLPKALPPLSRLELGRQHLLHLGRQLSHVGGVERAPQFCRLLLHPCIVSVERTSRVETPQSQQEFICTVSETTRERERKERKERKKRRKKRRKEERRKEKKRETYSVVDRRQSRQAGPPDSWD